MMKDWKQPLLDAMTKKNENEADVVSIEQIKNSHITVTTHNHVYTSQGDEFIAIKR